MNFNKHVGQKTKHTKPQNANVTSILDLEYWMKNILRKHFLTYNSIVNSLTSSV